MGITRILAHTTKGFEIICNLNNAEKEEIAVNNAVKGVKEMLESISFNENRSEFFKDVVSMQDKAFFEKWFPDTVRVKFSRRARATCMKLGIYGPMKRIARIILGKE